MYVVLGSSDSIDKGQEVADFLLEWLDISKKDLVGCSYIDFIEKKESKSKISI